MLLHFPTPMYTRAHAHRHTCSRSYITHPHMHVCAWTCTCVHRYRYTHSPTQTPTCSHIYMHARIVTHVHTLILNVHTCAHMHRLPPTCTDSPPHAHTHACTHTYTHAHAATHTDTCTHMHTCMHSPTQASTSTCMHTRVHTHLLQTLCFSHHKQHDVSESLLTLLPLLRPCSRPDRDVVRRGRPAPGQYLELQPLALLHVRSC